MIDRIDNNSYTNAYRSSSVNKVSKEDTPQFLLNYDEDGVVWDRQDTNDKKQINKTGTKEKSDKRDTFESTIINNDASKNAAVANDSEIIDIAGIVKNVAKSVTDFFKNIFNFIWYGDDNQEKEKSVNDSEIKETTVIDSRQKDKLIRESIEKKDSKEVMRLLTDDYKKQPARNSTLLTHYDRRGNIVNVNGADEERILSGKNAIKL